MYYYRIFKIKCSYLPWWPWSILMCCGVCVQRRCGCLGVFRNTNNTEQPAFTNPGQIIHSQQQPEGQGQQDTFTFTTTQAKPLAAWTVILTACAFLFYTQPDGAESVASLHSIDNISEKKAAASHWTDPDAPAISVSQASVSSGNYCTFWSYYYSLHLSCNTLYLRAHLHSGRFISVVPKQDSLLFPCWH